MKKYTLALPIGAGIAAMALFTTLVQADSVRYDDLNNLALDMPEAAIAASDTATGKIIEISLAQAIDIVGALDNGVLVEAELENEDGKLIWEVELIDSSNHEIEFHVDAATGEILN